jgi:hypothetical protein
MIHVIFYVFDIKPCLERKMTNGTTEVRSFLKDLSLSGCATIPKKKLLWMLGWGQDRPGAWKGLLDHWRELGEDPKSLYGSEANDKVILAVNPREMASVLEWAEEVE